MEIPFKELDQADLAVDAVYKGGTKNKNLADEVLHILLPRCGNSGGFRKVKRQDGSGKIAYVVLYTSMQERIVLRYYACMSLTSFYLNC